MLTNIETSQHTILKTNHAVDKKEVLQSIDSLEKKVLAYLRSSAMHGCQIHPSELSALFIKEKMKYYPQQILI